MNANTSVINNMSDLKKAAPGCKVYEYKLTKFSIMVNPPILLIARLLCIAVISITILFLVFKTSAESLLWIILVIELVIAWKVFRPGLALYSEGKLISLIITDKLFASEVNGRFFWSPKIGVKVQRGLAGAHIISRPQGDCLLINKDAISFEELKAKFKTE